MALHFIVNVGGYLRWQNCNSQVYKDGYLIIYVSLLPSQYAFRHARYFNFNRKFCSHRESL
jgi:hypothetical protein